MIFEIYWKAIYFIQLDYLKIEQTREDWSDHCLDYFKKAVHFVNLFLCDPNGVLQLQTFLNKKLSASISGIKKLLLLLLLLLLI